MRALPSDELCQQRLAEIFSPEAFDRVLSNPLAARSVAAMLFVDAVVPDVGDPPADAFWARPSMCLWLSNEAYTEATDEFRVRWRTAAARNRGHVAALHAERGEALISRYADNTRETLRDETFPKWLDFHALRDRPGVATSSSRGRWALTASFADLFDPALDDEAASMAIVAWQKKSLNPGAMVKAASARDKARGAVSVPVTLPDGTVRVLEFGETSLILKGVIETWATMRLREPVVLTISEPSAKVWVVDQARLQRFGIRIDAANLLPDAVIVDVGSDPADFWIVEAVASDGPIDEDRKKALEQWAETQGIAAKDCRFLTAFFSRNATPARRRLKDLAAGTFAWYADEPHHELAWYELNAQEPT